MLHLQHISLLKENKSNFPLKSIENSMKLNDLCIETLSLGPAFSLFTQVQSAIVNNVFMGLSDIRNTTYHAWSITFLFVDSQCSLLQEANLLCFSVKGENWTQKNILACMIKASPNLLREKEFYKCETCFRLINNFVIFINNLPSAWLIYRIVLLIKLTYNWRKKKKRAIYFNT